MLLRYVFLCGVGGFILWHTIKLEYWKFEFWIKTDILAN